MTEELVALLRVWTVGSRTGTTLPASTNRGTVSSGASTFTVLYNYSEINSSSEYFLEILMAENFITVKLFRVRFDDVIIKFRI